MPRPTVRWRAAVIGVSLIELMVALVIGLVLVAGAVTVFIKARDIYGTNDSVSRLQETARLAMSVIETDVRMANYWGLMSRATFIENRACGTAIATTVTGTCGTQVACPGGTVTADATFDADNHIDGLNGALAGTTLASTGRALSCNAVSGANIVTGSDVLIVRRASSNALAPAATPAADTAYLATTRTAGTIFIGNTLPTSYSSLGVTTPPSYEVRPLISNVYYVADRSVDDPNFPSLRRKQLVAGSSGRPALIDQEIAPGVEDLQVLFGWDTVGGGDARADVYLPPQVVPASGNIVAVRVCMTIRSQTLDLGLDNADYTDCRGQTLPTNNLRRLLVSQTIQLRNLRR
jgi:type IV pilus assembly protein PilW